MRHDGPIPGFRLATADTDPGGTRRGSTRFRPWTRGRLALLLAAAIGLPWVPAFESPPDGPPVHRARGHSEAMIWRFAFSPDGQTIAAADGRAVVTLRRADHGWSVDRTLAFSGMYVAFSPNGRRLVAGGRDADVVSCDPDRETPAHPLGIPIREASELRYSPDGRTLAVASYRSPEIILWDVEAGRPARILRGHTSPVVAMAFAPDGRSLAASPEVLIWDLATGHVRQRLPADAIISLAYSPDGRRLALVDGREKSARIFDLTTGGLIASIGRHALPIRSVAFSPDGRLLATAGGDGIAGLWSVESGLPVRRLDGQADLLRHLAFSPDGRILAATANDNDIRLWDLDGLADRPTVR